MPCLWNPTFTSRGARNVAEVAISVLCAVLIVGLFNFHLRSIYCTVIEHVTVVSYYIPFVSPL